ncbi:carbohydrate porin [Vibrio pacinii]|uniref:carbohydrate porin n=1 Tax=Vibrio pacinii TaxID=170674 RepID=UPI000571B6C4|nr:carbohydrate porin [Vibrio pacinii]
MKHFKVLPLAAIIATSMASFASTAETDVASLEKRIQELETKLETNYFDDQQPAVLSSETEVPAGIVFSGYARYGAHYQGSDAKRVGSFGSLNANATGRLGNEGNGGEFQFAKAFQSDGGAIWDIVLMMEHWADPSWASDPDIGLKKFYAGATNLFESQKDLYIWAGRDFHQRPQTDLNDYFWMSHDGQGAGFYNLDLGGVKLNVGAVGEIDGGNVSDSGRYAVTTKLHGFNLGETFDLSLYANYGWDSKQVDSREKIEAYQVAAELGFLGQKLIVRYADNAKDSVLYSYAVAEDQNALLVQFDGGQSLTDRAGIQYSVGYQSLDVSGSESRVNYHAIVRPTYQWDDVHSTWFEAGYNVVDYKDFDAQNSSWKATVSQNMAIGGETWSRPMLRFYATVGNQDNEFTGVNEDPTDLDTLTVGAMFEAWW